MPTQEPDFSQSTQGTVNSDATLEELNALNNDIAPRPNPENKRQKMLPQFNRLVVGGAFAQYEDAYNQNLSRDFTVDHISELYYIAHIDNLESILRNGILSHKRAGKLSTSHTDISNVEVQDRRAKKRLERTNPEKKPLSIHRHAVLYLNAHNAMMFNVNRKDICVIRVNRSILNRGDAVISNRNASAYGAEFFTTTSYRLDPVSAAKLVRNKSNGVDDSGIRESEEDFTERKQIRQSEVLLPYEIRPAYFAGIIVKSANDRNIVQAILEKINNLLPLHIEPSVFCQGRMRILLEKFPAVGNIAETQNHELPDSSSDEEEENAKPVEKLRRG